MAEVSESINEIWLKGFHPIHDVVAVGECQFDENWKSVPLKNKFKIAPSVYVFSFAVPDGKTSLNLPTSSCILAKGIDSEGNEVVRPYTPVSTNTMWGRFEVMIKIYPDGKFGNYVNNLSIGDMVEFKQIPINVKIQYPYKNRKYYGMLVGGTGITPMIQALHALLGDADNTSQVSIVAAFKNEEDILARNILDYWSDLYKDRLEITYCLSEEDKDSSWKGARGHIDEKLIGKHFATPEEDVMIFVCGPSRFYDSFCGPRDERDKVTGVLGDMGYSVDQVYKF